MSDVISRYKYGRAAEEAAVGSSVSYRFATSTKQCSLLPVSCELLLLLMTATMDSGGTIINGVPRSELPEIITSPPEKSGNGTGPGNGSGSGNEQSLARSATLKHASSSRPVKGHTRRRSSHSSAIAKLSTPLPSLEPGLPSPVGDFQSDNVLNSSSTALALPPPAVSPVSLSPISGPVLHVGLPPPGGIPVLEKLRLEEDELRDDGVRYEYDSRGGTNGLMVGHSRENGNGDGHGHGNGHRGGHISPGLVDWNPFLPPGLESWTRESWARRKVALISGITGQGQLASTGM
jgi:hypothetical protein